MMARLTQAQWRSLIEEQSTSEQTAVAFCAERGIDYKHFSTRKKTIGDAIRRKPLCCDSDQTTRNQSIQLHSGVVQLRMPTSVSARGWLS